MPKYFPIITTLTITILLFILLPSGAAYGEVMDENGESYSFYMISCGNYIERRTSQETTDKDTADTFYVAGWISAYNRLTKNIQNVAEDTDLESIMFWLEKYFRDNPLSNLESGLYHLATEKYPAPAPRQPEKLPPVSQAPAKPQSKFHELPF